MRFLINVWIVDTANLIFCDDPQKANQFPFFRKENYIDNLLKHFTFLFTLILTKDFIIRAHSFYSFCQTSAYQASFFVSCTQLWNSLPDYVVCAPSASSFKHSLLLRTVCECKFYISVYSLVCSYYITCIITVLSIAGQAIRLLFAFTHQMHLHKTYRNAPSETELIFVVYLHVNASISSSTSRHYYHYSQDWKCRMENFAQFLFQSNSHISGSQH